MHWIKWKTLCQPKTEGGLGLRDMQQMNKAFVMQHGWGIIHNNINLLLVIKLVYQD